MERVIHRVYPVYSKFFTRKSLILFCLLLLACVGIVAYSVAQTFSGTVTEEPGHRPPVQLGGYWHHGGAALIQFGRP